MKFTDGFWQHRPGVSALYAQEAYDIRVDEDGRGLSILAPTRVVTGRGDTLNRPALTVQLRSPLEGVLTVRVVHHDGGRREPGFDLVGARPGHGEVEVDGDIAVLRSGTLSATVRRGAPWSLELRDGDRLLTASGAKSLGLVDVAPDAEVEPGPVGNARAGSAGPRSTRYVHEQLDLGVGETIYGLGERFGPLVKNGQTVDIWNADGGTSSEQAYKNVPFYLSSRGYGVLVDHTGHVSFEVGSEAVERVQFSVAGEELVYHVVSGGTPAGVLERYTALTGRPPLLPAWASGLWLTTSFTTDYDEATVTSFIDGMAERDIPLEVFHFDCFWMREFQWCDFAWDTRVFPDPDGMLARLHERGLKVCVWINPYIAQRSPLFEEGAEKGYLVRRPDGSVWQWDLWQSGMALVDFTDPGAVAWYQGHLRRLLEQGVDSFKTDFGERIPLDVVWSDGADPERMHNRYADLYNRAVWDVLREHRGEGEAVLFARSATAGGQTMPVHWGGDNSSTLVSMAESLRGGLSLALSGFGYWSHDIGGFEGMPDPVVFKRWVAFGLLSSHSRLHGSQNYRVPWLFDEAEGRDEADPLSAVSVLRRFTRLKLSLLPYLQTAGREAASAGLPVMRPMVLAFPDDPACRYLDRQYLLGPDLLVAPVFDADGAVELYLPRGRWTDWWTGEVVEGGGWRTERHALDSLPLYVREGAVLPTGPGRDAHTPILDDLALVVAEGGPDTRVVSVGDPDDGAVEVRVERRADGDLVTSDRAEGLEVRRPGGDAVPMTSGQVLLPRG